jgi:hypothetical protein
VLGEASGTGTAGDTGAGGPTGRLEGSPTPAGIPGVIREYQLIKQLGEGGMGSVFLARHRRLQRDVALKLLPPQLADDPWYRGRFEREMAAVGALDHPNLVRAYDAGAEGHHLFLSMELLDGEDLGNLALRRGRIGVADACEAVRQAALGLHDAHQRGLVHRDIKPTNLFLTRSGVVKVIDLGLSRARTSGNADGLSTAKTLVGTPEFMAPEQWESTEVDHRADIYGLACSLFNLLTGQPPFGKQVKGGWARLAVAHTAHPRPQLRGSVPDAPRPLCDLLERMMAMEPDKRPRTAADVAVLLAPFTEGHDLPALLTGEPSQRATPSQRMRKRRTYGALAAAGVVAVCGAAWGIWQATRPPAATATPAPAPKPAPPERVAVAPFPREVAEAPPGPVALHPVRTLKHHTDGVTTAAFSPDGKYLATGSKDKTILLWNTTTWKTRPPLEGHPGDVIGLAFSPDGSELASVTSGRDEAAVRIWDVGTASAKRTLGGASPGMWGVAWSGDGGTIASGGWDRSLHLWDARAATDKERLVVPDVITKYLRGLTISRDGKRVVTGGGGADGATRVWDAATGDEVVGDHKMPGGMCPTFLAGDKEIAGWIYSRGAIAICEVPSGLIRATWKAHPAIIEGLAVAPDGRHIVTLGREGVARVWASADESEVATLTGHRGPIYAAAFSPDGRFVATTGIEDGTVRVWELPPACRVRK